MDDDDFNSSDIEIPDKPNPYAHLGEDSINSMLDRQFEDRVESKIASKQLQQVTGAPSTQFNRALWFQRFTKFCEGTLRHKAGTIPKGEDIERFILSIIKHLRPRGAHTVKNQISYICIYSGLKAIINGCQFRIAEFNLTKKDRLRLNSVIATLLKEGKITKDPAREKQWLGAHIIGGMAKAVLIDAVDNGTLSWDVTICRVLSIVLVSALCSRSGDVAQTTLYGPKAGEEADADETARIFEMMICMKFRHVEIKLLNKYGVERLSARFEIAYGKGAKDTQQDNPKKPLGDLQSPDLNWFCVVKLLLIYALRIGAVDSSNIQDLLTKTRNRRDKTIQWALPDYPILPAFQKRARGIIPEKPASTGNPLKNFRLGAELLGIAVPVTVHDARRGAASDLANIHAPINGLLSDNVAAGLNHSKKAVEMGVTRAYIGGVKTDTWAIRTAAIGTVDNDFDVDVAPIPFKRRKYTREGEITQYCLDNDLDPGRGADRQTASRRIREAEKKAHFDSQEYAVEESQMVSTILQPRSASQLNQGLNQVGLKRKQPEDSEYTNTDPSLRPRPLDTPGVMHVASSIKGLLTGRGNVNVSETLEIFDPMCNNALDKAVPSCLILEPMDFVDYFSKINIINSVHDPTNQVSGGSRDKWSRFQHCCPNHIFGCPATFNRVSMANDHAVSCKYTSLDVREELDRKKLDEETREKTHKCTNDGCDKSYDNKESLRNHKKRCGKWVPKGCIEEGCDPTIIFETRGAMSKHRMNKHGSFTPRTCPLAHICNSTFNYTNRESYKSHLVRTHKLAGKELAQHMPSGKGAEKGENMKKSGGK